MSGGFTDDRIQLLVDGEGNRRALSELLEERYSVVTGDRLRDVDLYVVDDRSLPQYRDRLEARKREKSEAFRPVVLVRREGTRLDLELPEETDGDPPLIDEVVAAPVEREVFFRRLSNLLVRREQVGELTAKNERLEEFADFVSHDLRNPLQVAQGHLAMLEDPGENAHVEAIEASLEQMEEVTEAVLTLARQDVDEDAVTDVSLPNAVERAWEEAETAEATLVLEEDLTVWAEEKQLCRLLGNLFRNAVEHAGDTVTVRVGTLESGFFVADDGPGIPPDQRDAVLVKGYTTDPDGTGLGLNIVSAVAEAHGWEVSVTESDSGGARFEITGAEVG